MDPPAEIPLWTAAPFAALLLAIAVLPLAAGHWWERNRNKGIVAAALSVPVAVWLVHAGLGDRLPHAAFEYVSFLVLLGSLFTISGGILLDGDLRATPRVNTAFLGVGALIASLVGTTGASMLLIRPLLRTNRERRRVVHTVVFFIFVVSNCGGCLTPLGDPPLFLGYLRGVPFGWTLSLWPQWLAVNGALLAVYLVWDTLAARKESAAALRTDRESYEPLRLRGGVNVALLLGVVAAVALLTAKTLGTSERTASLLRDGTLLALAASSVALTRRDVRERNGFSWGPIVEVAVLFAGIFVTMLPALLHLAASGHRLGVDTPREFFWATGVLSSFLDNAPTYLTFSSVASSILNAASPGAGFTTEDLLPFTQHARGAELLRAISLGAVFMGANTYIGNGPNFMVKAIADASGVKMPSFFGYMLFSVCVLLPLFAVVAFVWF